MTIKPVVAAPQKRTGNSAAGGADGDKKDTPNVGDSANSNHPSTNRVSSVHAHRNVVIDNHGQVGKAHQRTKILIFVLLFSLVYFPFTEPPASSRCL